MGRHRLATTTMAHQLPIVPRSPDALGQEGFYLHSGFLHCTYKDLHDGVVHFGEMRGPAVDIDTWLCNRTDMGGLPARC